MWRKLVGFFYDRPFPSRSFAARSSASGLQALESRVMLSTSYLWGTLASAPPTAVESPAAVRAAAPAGSVDLTIQFGAVSLPVTAVSGSSVKFIVPVVVTNQGTGPVTGVGSMAINLYARPVGALDSSQDVLIGSIPNAGVGGLQPGASKPFNPAIVLPLYLATGDYNVVALVNANNAVTESNTANNSAVTPAAIAVTAGTVDLQAGLVTANLAASATTGKPTSGTVKVVIKNTGNVALPLNQNVLVTLYARPVGAVGSFSDILLAASGESVSNLKPGQSVTRSIHISAIPTNVAPGQYSIAAFVDSTNIVAEPNENNNVGVSTDIVAINGRGGVGGTNPPVDLAITGASMTLAPINPDGASGQATVNFTNAGINAATGSFTINVYAVAVNDQDNNAILVGSSGSQVLNLAAGTAGTTTSISVTLPDPVSSAGYELIAEIIPASGDLNFANNVLDIGPVTVAPIVPLLGFLPTTMTFNQAVPPVVSGTTSTSSGTFAGGGQTGTYTWVANTSGPSTNQGTLTITLNGSPPDHGSFTLTMAVGQAPASLDTDTITFQTASTGDTGSFIATVASLGTANPTGFFVLS